MNQPAAEQAKKSSLRWIILIPFVIVLGVMAAVVRQGEAAPINTQSTKVSAAITGATDAGIKKMVRNNIKMYVKAESNDYDHSRLGGISNLEISVKNPTDYKLDKVRVKILYIKANGDVYETKYEDFTGIKPNSTVTHKITDTKRGTSVKYEVATIKSKALGLG